MASGGNLTLNDVTIANGNAGVGGGIGNYGDGTSTLTDSAVSGNTSIFNQAQPLAPVGGYIPRVNRLGLVALVVVGVVMVRRRRGGWG